MMWVRSIRRPLSSLILLQSYAPNYSSLSVSAAAVEAERCIKEGPRNNWTRDEIKSIYDSPLLDLLFHGVRILFYF